MLSLSLSFSLVPSDKRVESPERGKQRVCCCTSFACFPGVFISSLPEKRIGSAKQIANARESKSVFASVGRSSDSPPGFERERCLRAPASCELISYRVRGRWGNYCRLVKMKFVLPLLNGVHTRRNIWPKEASSCMMKNTLSHTKWHKLDYHSIPLFQTPFRSVF